MRRLSPTAARWLDACLARSPAQAWFRWRAARRLLVLAYHGVDDPARFAAQLDHLAAELAPISLAQLLAALEGGPELPRRAVLVTFDDGDPSVHRRGLPLLAERGIPAVAFVIAGLIDGDAPPWWAEVEALSRNGGRARDFPGLSGGDLARVFKEIGDEARLAALTELRASAGQPVPRTPQLTTGELRELEAGGVTVGSHTLSHAILPRCDDRTLEREIRAAHDRLSEALGHPPAAFAYPNGGADPRATRLLAELGYRAAFLFDHRLSAAPPGDRYRVSRLRVNSDTSMDRFRILLSGLHPALHRARGGA